MKTKIKIHILNLDILSHPKRAIRANGRRCTLYPQPRPPNKTPV